MPKKSRLLSCYAVATLLLVILGSWAASTWFSAAAAADHSAHAALMHEILEQLSAVPSGQPYPTSLSQLSLTYPDGGDSSLLTRFEYQSDGKSYMLRTVLGDEIVTKSAP